MTLNRSLIGTLVGVVVAILWITLGAASVLLIVILGVAGFGLGWVLEHPQGSIGLLRRLER